MPMTPKQERFVAEYLIDENGTQAAIRAGYHPRSARNQAARMMTNDDIAAAIEVGRKRKMDKLNITAEMVLAEIARVAFGDIKGIYDASGNLRPIHELEETISATIAGIEVQVERSSRKNPDGADEGATVTHTHKIRRWDKLRALEMLAKYHGLLRERVEHTGKDGGPIEFNNMEAARRVAFMLAEADSKSRGEKE